MSPSKHPQRWRENLEALTMAIVVALLFKYFILEISKIPSGSMQPTLMGNPETGVFDRTVVDKLSFRYRDPERFEIVVFKHPLERSRIMVKRLVGMPGEELKIERGDLWTRKDESEPWRILRRPPPVQREMWREVGENERRRARWSVVRGGKEWRMADDSIVARGDGEARFREGAWPIQDRYLDGYPPSLEQRLAASYPSRGENAVGDVRLEGELEALSGTESVSFQLTEGQRIYEFELPGPRSEAAAASVCIRDSVAGTERVEHGVPARLAALQRVDFAVENLDDRLALELDGRTVLAVEIEPSERQQVSLTVAVAGEGADLVALRVLRDVYYLVPEKPGERRERWEVTIPPGHYVMLGDNTQDSADSRLWEAKTYEYRVEGGAGTVKVRGNHRDRENPSFGALDGADAIRFRDQWGEIHWFARRSLGPGESIPGNAPLVPRELVVGRAMAVFWPIRPFDGLWRVGWLH